MIPHEFLIVAPCRRLLCSIRFINCEIVLQCLCEIIGVAKVEVLAQVDLLESAVANVPLPGPASLSSRSSWLGRWHDRLVES